MSSRPPRLTTTLRRAACWSPCPIRPKAVNEVGAVAEVAEAAVEAAFAVGVRFWRWITFSRSAVGFS